MEQTMLDPDSKVAYRRLLNLTGPSYRKPRIHSMYLSFYTSILVEHQNQMLSFSTTAPHSSTQVANQHSKTSKQIKIEQYRAKINNYVVPRRDSIRCKV